MDTCSHTTPPEVEQQAVWQVTYTMRGDLNRGRSFVEYRSGFLAMQGAQYLHRQGLQVTGIYLGRTLILNQSKLDALLADAPVNRRAPSPLSRRVTSTA